MFPLPSPLARRRAGLGIAWAALVLLAGGCSRGPKLVPVKGKVMLGGKPLTSGLVNYIPEKETPGKGFPFGKIESDGSYELTTDGKSGAPLGTYKVTVSSAMPPGADVPQPKTGGKPGGPPPATGGGVPSIYLTAKTTPLTKTVTEDASSGAYDLTLKK